MAKKSDRSIRERRVSATRASRAFSKLLDEVEAGKCFLIERRGRDVCAMAPPVTTGRRASECLALLRDRAAMAPDDRFGDDLLAIVATEVNEGRPTWDS